MAGSHTPDDGRERNEADEPFEAQDEATPFDEDYDQPQPDRLALDEDDSLPWLESGDEALDDEASDTGRLVGFVLMGLVALAAIVGGIWWATHRTADPELLADGSTIEAPATPFKGKPPKDPGGKTFDGTGDSSFAVSEGQTRPARLGEGDAAVPKPSIDIAPTPAAKAPAPAASAAPTPAAATGGVGVQVGAYSTRAKAEEGWTRLAANPALSGVRHRVVEGQADIGTVYRLQAVAADREGAHALCSRLKAAGIACQVKN